MDCLNKVRLSSEGVGAETVGQRDILSFKHSKHALLEGFKYLISLISHIETRGFWISNRLLPHLTLSP